MSQRLITHYVARDIVPNFWIPLVYITKREENGEEVYSFGLEDREVNNWIKNAEQNGQVEKLEESALILLQEASFYGDSLWLDPEGNIWLSSRAHPVEFYKKKIVGILKGD